MFKSHSQFENGRLKADSLSKTIMNIEDCSPYHTTLNRLVAGSIPASTIYSFILNGLHKIMAGRPGTKYPRIVAIMVILCLAKMSSARNRPQSLPLRAQL